MKSTWAPIDTGDLAANRLINTASALADQAAPVWWWISFCDHNRPDGQKFLGACIVRAPNAIAAAREAWERKCNPGGEAAFLGPLDEDKLPIESWRNRLLTKAEAESL